MTEQEAEARRLSLTDEEWDALGRKEFEHIKELEAALSKAEQEQQRIFDMYEDAERRVGEALQERDEALEALEVTRGGVVGKMDAEVRAEAAEAQLKEVLEAGREMERRWQEAEARELGILAAWYRHDALSCANYCDNVLDKRGALLGRVRDAALQATQEDGAR